MSFDAPRFFVVLPTRNGPGSLGAAAESVLEQAHSGFGTETAR